MPRAIDYSYRYCVLFHEQFCWADELRLAVIVTCGFSFFQKQNEFDIVALIAIVEVFFAFVTTFSVCELCQRMTDKFSHVNDALCNIDWYLLPKEMQKMLPIVIMFAQEPFNFEIFGTISSNCELFEKVRQSMSDDITGTMQDHLAVVAQDYQAGVLAGGGSVQSCQ